MYVNAPYMDPKGMAMVAMDGNFTFCLFTYYFKAINVQCTSICTDILVTASTSIYNVCACTCYTVLPVLYQYICIYICHISLDKGCLSK